MGLDWSSMPAWKPYTAFVDYGANPALKPWGSTPVPDFFPDNPVNQKAAVRGQLSQYGCPFVWLLNKPFTLLF